MKKFLSLLCISILSTIGINAQNQNANEDILFVYLSNGNVDAYEKSIMDGEHYIENGKLYIPLKDSEMVYYGKEEYDSCSKVKPVLPTMETYKFNNNTIRIFM